MRPRTPTCMHPNAHMARRIWDGAAQVPSPAICITPDAGSMHPRQVHMCICTHICTHAHTHAHMRTHIQTHPHMHTCIHACSATRSTGWPTCLSSTSGSLTARQTQTIPQTVPQTLPQTLFTPPPPLTARAPHLCSLPSPAAPSHPEAPRHSSQKAAVGAAARRYACMYCEKRTGMHGSLHRRLLHRRRQ